jgi:hypothetical protein
VIKRVTDKQGHGFCERLEFFVFISIACDVFLINTVCAELSPLVVVATEEEVKGIAELIVFRDLLGGKVAMIIDNWKILYKSVKLFGSFGLQHKIVFNKSHNNIPSLFIIYSYYISNFLLFP